MRHAGPGNICRRPASGLFLACALQRVKTSQRNVFEPRSRHEGRQHQQWQRQRQQLARCAPLINHMCTLLACALMASVAAAEHRAVFEDQCSPAEHPRLEISELMAHPVHAKQRVRVPVKSPRQPQPLCNRRKACMHPSQGTRLVPCIPNKSNLAPLRPSLVQGAVSMGAAPAAGAAAVGQRFALPAAGHTRRTVQGIPKNNATWVALRPLQAVVRPPTAMQRQGAAWEDGQGGGAHHG